MKIILVFKTHFDIGFTQMAEDVICQYSGKMLSDVIQTCEGTSDMGLLRYVWTMPSWPLTVMRQNREKREKLDRLVKEGHCFPCDALYSAHGFLRYVGCDRRAAV